MAYVKTVWTNGATALSAEHMNNIEDGIAALDTGKTDKAFSKVKVGSTTIEADAREDTLELVAGNLISLTPDATNDKVTIASTAKDIVRKSVTHQETKTIAAQSIGYFQIDVDLANVNDYVGFCGFNASNGNAFATLCLAHLEIYSKNNLMVGLFNGTSSSQSVTTVEVQIAYKTSL